MTDGAYRLGTSSFEVSEWVGDGSRRVKAEFLLSPRHQSCKNLWITIV